MRVVQAQLQKLIVNLIIKNFILSQIQLRLRVIDSKTNVLSFFLIDKTRNEIILQFFQNIRGNLKSFIFGPNLQSIPIIQYFNGNPHNSYLGLYSHFGLIGFLLIIIMISLSLWRYIMNSDAKFYMLLSIVSRSFTDNIAFIGDYDVLFFLLVFGIILMKDKNINGNNYIN